MTNTENMRQRLLAQANVHNVALNGVSLDEALVDFKAKQAELQKVVDHAMARLAMGTFQYGTADNHDRYDYALRLGAKLTMYFGTLNTEYLVDVVNYAALEFNHGHPENYFHADDTGVGSNRNFDQ